MPPIRSNHSRRVAWSSCRPSPSASSALSSGRGLEDALLAAAKARFRPIFLTSVTTFLGVAPLIFERSIQAQFLAPTAVSLGFGILFATLLIMIVVPALVMQQNRIALTIRRRFGGGEEPVPAAAVAVAGD